MIVVLGATKSRKRKSTSLRCKAKPKGETRGELEEAIKREANLKQIKFA